MEIIRCIRHSLYRFFNKHPCFLIIADSISGIHALCGMQPQQIVLGEGTRD